MTYTIDNQTNLIMVHLTADDAAVASTAAHFTSEAGLSELAASWPGARVIEVWNNIPGVTTVKKFKDRATGIARIWKAIQPVDDPATEATAEKPAIEATGVPEPAASEESVESPDRPSEITEEPEPTATPEAAQTPNVASQEAPATTKPTRAKKAAKPSKEPKGSRQGSKTANVIDLVQREGGATLAEIMETTGWQAHSVRGFISGTLVKKMGLTVISAKGEDGIRRYSIKS